MTSEKITDLVALAGADFADGDLVVVVDVSDTTMAPTGTNKKSTVVEVTTGIVSAAAVSSAGAAMLADLPVTVAAAGAAMVVDLPTTVASAGAAMVADLPTTVAAAGALMDAELTSAVDVKALDQSVVTGASPVFGIANMTLDDTGLVVVNTANLQTFADDVDHSLFKARGTGVNTTYVAAVVVGGTTFDMPEVFGEIKSDQSPGYFDIHYLGATGVTVANLNATSTYVYIDNAGVLQQQTTIPTRQDWSRKIFTMRIAVNPATNLILAFEYLNNPIGNSANSIRDLYQALLAQGVPFRTDQVVTGRATDLGFDVSAGTLLEFGGTGNIDNPNIRSLDAVANASYSLLSRTAVVSQETDLVKFWDNAGVITALGSTTLVAHRLYRFSSGNFAMQYGQANYANMTLAKAGAPLEEFVLNPRLANATFFGWWFIEDIATNTGGTTTTDFVEYVLGVQGGSSSGLSGANLRANNLSDVLDAVAAAANLGVGPTTSINTQTGTAYTFALSDAATISSVVTFDNASPVTVTVPPNVDVAFPTGSKLDIVGLGAGLVTVAAGAGVTVNASPTLGLRAQYSRAELLKIGPDVWLLSGDLASS
jgi:hypothetical protein